MKFKANRNVPWVSLLRLSALGCSASLPKLKHIHSNILFRLYNNVAQTFPTPRLDSARLGGLRGAGWLFLYRSLHLTHNLYFCISSLLLATCFDIQTNVLMHVILSSHCILSFFRSISYFLLVTASNQLLSVVPTISISS